MATLNDVQTEVNRQLTRDYADRTSYEICMMTSYGLVEEAGEVAGLEKRVLRNFSKDKERATQENFIDEMGDVLWYLAACCTAHGTSLEEIWEHNKKKLEERYGK